eukprot:1173980-Lingulodinium_polyedra.AAC.1
MLKKQPSQEVPALPHLYEALWDAPEPEVVTDAEGEPEPMLALMDGDLEGSELSEEDNGPEKDGDEEAQGPDSASDGPLGSSGSE